MLYIDTVAGFYPDYIAAYIYKMEEANNFSNQMKIPIFVHWNEENHKWPSFHVLFFNFNMLFIVMERVKLVLGQTGWLEK